MVTPQWELLHTGLFCCGSFFHRSICLSLERLIFFLVGIYFQNLHVDDFANLQFIFGFLQRACLQSGKCVPDHLRRVPVQRMHRRVPYEQPYPQRWSQLHICQLPASKGSFVCILQGQADFALFLIYIQNEYFNFLTFLQNLSGVGNSAPAHFGNVNQVPSTPPRSTNAPKSVSLETVPAILEPTAIVSNRAAFFCCDFLFNQIFFCRR